MQLRVWYLFGRPSPLLLLTLEFPVHFDEWSSMDEDSRVC